MYLDLKSFRISSKMLITCVMALCVINGLQTIKINASNCKCFPSPQSLVEVCIPTATISKTGEFVQLSLAPICFDCHISRSDTQDRVNSSSCPRRIVWNSLRGLHQQSYLLLKH